MFEEWRTLYDLEPWDAERADLAAGGLMAILAAAHGIKPRPPADYMPLLRHPDEKPQSEEDMRAVIDAVSAAMEKRLHPGEQPEKTRGVR